MLSIPATLLFLLATFLHLNNQAPTPVLLAPCPKAKWAILTCCPSGVGLWPWPCLALWSGTSARNIRLTGLLPWNSIIEILLYYEHVYFICLSALVMFAESIWPLLSGSLGAGMHCILARDGILSATCLQSFPVHSHVGCFDVFAFRGRR